MGQYLNVGNAGFRSILKGQYVDKTGMIEYINSTLGTPQKMTCVSRPRRFGKSFAAKMLCAYYDKSCDSKILFEGLEISVHPDFEKYLNSYYVLYLDMTVFLSGSSEERKYALSRMQKVILTELHESFPQIIPLEETLPAMLAAVADKTGEKFIIIIDEWDAIFREMKHEKNMQDEYIRLLRGLFKDSGKTDKMIEAAYMTGILPIKKYGTHSALTDFEEYSMIAPEPLEKYVGFTEMEVKKLCETSKLKFEDMQRWYDGYILGTDIHVYSPKSVMDALRRGRLDSYWTQTETYESLRIYIDMDVDGLQEAISKLLCGEHILLDAYSFQNDMVSIRKKDDVLTLLVHLGYLVYDYEEKTVSIPNIEIRMEFARAVRNSGNEALVQLIRDSRELAERTCAMDSDFVAEAIAGIHETNTAPTFYNNEQALRSVIRMAYLSCIDDYQDIQELPSGTGYADIVYIPKRHSMKPAMIVELKWNKTADGAIEQIKSRNYPQILTGLAGEILLVGINYDTATKIHSCIIEPYKL